jgi:hypothetical protein
MTDEAIESNLAGRRWQHIHPGVYAAFTGSLPELARVWAGLLWAGEGAVLARSTALRGYGFIRIPDAGVVHILVDHARKVRDIAGVSVRRRRDLQRFVHPAKRPPTVRLEDAVLHEAAGRTRVTDGLALIADACQDRRTAPERLRATLDEFPRLRNRHVWLAVLDDVASGAHSFLEVHYLRGVERAHGLPSPDRQTSGVSIGKRVWRDGEYPDWGIVLELDGRLGHEWAADRGRDRRRDLVVAGRGEVTLRHGYADVLEEYCESAALVVRVLWSRGWQGQPTECGGGCRLREFLDLLETA